MLLCVCVCVCVCVCRLSVMIIGPHYWKWIHIGGGRPNGSSPATPYTWLSGHAVTTNDSYWNAPFSQQDTSLDIDCLILAHYIPDPNKDPRPTEYRYVCVFVFQSVCPCIVCLIAQYIPGPNTDPTKWAPLCYVLFPFIMIIFSIALTFCSLVWTVEGSVSTLSICMVWTIFFPEHSRFLVSRFMTANCDHPRPGALCEIPLPP